jgi:hypothetical protein
MKAGFKRALWIMMFMLVTLIPATAFAEIQAYLIKDGSTVYYYDGQALSKSYVNHVAEDSDTALYDDFAAKLASSGYYSFKTSEKGYIQYKPVADEFIEQGPDKFNIATYLASDKPVKVTDLPSTIQEAYQEGSTVKYRDLDTGSDGGGSGGSGGSGGDSSSQGLAVKFVYSIDNTHMMVKFNKIPTTSDYDKSKFSFNPSLSITKSELDSNDQTVVILTTAAQDSSKKYVLTYDGDSTGLQTEGLASGQSRPSAPTGITGNPDTGGIVGITDSNHEYSTDGGKTWKDYDPNNPPQNLSGEVWIRKKGNPPSLPLIIDLGSGSANNYIIGYRLRSTSVGGDYYSLEIKTDKKVFNVLFETDVFFDMAYDSNTKEVYFADTSSKYVPGKTITLKLYGDGATKTSNYLGKLELTLQKTDTWKK